MLQNGGDAFAEDFPTVPRYRYGPLLVAAENSLRLAQSYRPAGADGSGPHPPPPPPAGTLRNVLGDEWRFDGTHCVALGTSPVTVHLWLEQLLPELHGQGVTCGIQQGQYMRRLLLNPLRSELKDRIDQMPAIAAAVTAGTATLRDHYALALVSCCKHDDILRCHREATNPQRHQGEPLNKATTRAEHAARAAAALGYPLAPATQYWALHSVLSPAEHIAFTCQPCVYDLLVRHLHESPAAAADRYKALLADLLSWARTQTTLAPAGAGSARGTGGGGGGGGGGGSSGGGGGGGSRTRGGGCSCEGGSDRGWGGSCGRHPRP